jgi:hypothetical protein
MSWELMDENEIPVTFDEETLNNSSAIAESCGGGGVQGNC